jgi:hypothetical protein
MSEIKAYSYEYVGEYVYLRIPRCLLVFTKAAWIRGIRQGKHFKRHGGIKLKPKIGKEKTKQMD